VQSQQEAERVTVSSDGVWARPALLQQALGEECLEKRWKVGGDHDSFAVFPHQSFGRKLKSQARPRGTSRHGGVRVSQIGGEFRSSRPRPARRDTSRSMSAQRSDVADREAAAHGHAHDRAAF
jgi:hypothetical protein